MKHFILGLTFSAVSSLSILAGPLVGGGGGGVQVRIQSTDGNIIALTSDQVSDVKLKDENIVRFEELLKNLISIISKLYRNNFIKLIFLKNQKLLIFNLLTVLSSVVIWAVVEQFVNCSLDFPKTIKFNTMAFNKLLAFRSNLDDEIL